MRQAGRQSNETSVRPSVTLVIGCSAEELHLAVKLSARLALPLRHILFRLTNQQRRYETQQWHLYLLQVEIQIAGLVRRLAVFTAW